MLDFIAAVVNGYPLLWAMFGLSTLLPLVVVFTHCFWLKHLDVTAYQKKIDQPTPDHTATVCRTQNSQMASFSSHYPGLTVKVYKENLAMFKTVKEQPIPVEGTVKGFIPPWLSGRLLRNGPGMFEIGDTKYKHWFDGLALLHSFTITNGKVTYQSRYLCSQAYLQNMAANRIVVGGVWTSAYPDPCKNIFERIFSVFSLTDTGGNDNINIYPIGHDFVAASESHVNKFDAETLETKDGIELSKYFAVNTATAHAHYKGEATYNIGSSFNGRPHFNIIKIHPQIRNGSQLKMEVLCSIPTKRMTTYSYIHSFGMTEGYFVFLEQPLYINLSRIFINKLCGNPVAKGLFLFDNEKVQMCIVDRNTGKVVKTKYMSADTFFCFHHANTYEDKGHLVIDLCCYGNDILFEYYDRDVRFSEDFEKISKSIGSMTSVRRYVLPLELDEKTVGENLVTLDDTNASAILQKDGTVVCTHELLSPIAFELPQINYGMYNGKKYSILYGLSTFLVHGRDALVRLDIKTKQTKLWEEEDCIPSEPVFVARPGATEEDDGIVLSSILRPAVERSPFLLVLDARKFEEIARVEFEGVDIPNGIHGIFAPASFPGSSD